MYRPSLSCLVEQYMQFDVPDLACLARKASVGSVPCRVYARIYNTCTVSDGVIRIIWRIGQVKKSTVLYLFPPLLYSSKAFSVQKRYQAERMFLSGFKWGYSNIFKSMKIESYHSIKNYIHKTSYKYFFFNLVSTKVREGGWFSPPSC